jgi:hypothetical protein
MLRIIWIVVMCSFAIVVFTAEPADAITGIKYREDSDQLRMMYVVGVLDAWGFVSDAIRGSGLKAPEIDSVFGGMSRCVVGKMTHGQVVEIVDKWMVANPTKWPEEMAGLIWLAMREACKLPS